MHGSHNFHCLTLNFEYESLPMVGYCQKSLSAFLNGNIREHIFKFCLYFAMWQSIKSNKITQTVFSLSRLDSEI